MRVTQTGYNLTTNVHKAGNNLVARVSVVEGEVGKDRLISVINFPNKLENFIHVTTSLCQGLCPPHVSP